MWQGKALRWGLRGDEVQFSDRGNVNAVLQAGLVKHSDADFKRLAAAASHNIP
jgi:hypothetical protein